jgi:DNA-binding winged helix-turn-helix (wHTH) protein/predicted ATPase
MVGSYVFGPFRLDVSAEILFRGGEPLPLGRRAVALLRTLIENTGLPVAKDALMEAAWPGLAVEESNLSVQIAALRKVLGEEPGADKWIETLPRRGYRFVGEVRQGPKPAEDASPGVEPTPGAEAAPAANKSVTAERRQLTVASCELLLEARGSMDPEDLREIVRSYQGCVADTARRYDAFVAHTHGNTASLFFGYPHAREDDAERAVHAALPLIAAVASLESPIPLHARIGIATGLVVVGEPASLGGAPEVAGETPNIASRLHAIAAPDEVVIAESTRRLLGAMFELRDLGEQNLAGVAKGGHAFQVVRPSSVVSRFDALHTDGFTTLVGREEELELLLRRWSRAKAGQGQVVLLSGEAGIGKSRLAAALSEAIAGEPQTRLRYFCSPQHIDSAFYPIISHLERAAGFARDDAPQIKVDKLDALFARVSISKEDAPLFAELLSVTNDGRYPTFDLAPQQRRERTLDACTAQMEALSRRNPLLIIFEDAHWSDPTTLESFSRAVDRLKTLRILLLVTFRPEFQAPWVGRPYVTSLTINRLTEREADAMIDYIVGDKSLPLGVRRDINARTDGIPLFVEEMTEAILEARSEAAAERTGATVPFPEPAPPPSLQASLMARLDRLGPAKETAQMGAAIGREFSQVLLAAVVRKPEAELTAALDRLIEAGLLFRQGVPPHATYLFKHALVRDAAYGTLLREPRRALHACIAETLETEFAEIADSRPELLARHCTEAGLVEKSVAGWAKAGRRSVARSAMVEAAAQLQKGLDQLGLLPDTHERQGQELEFWSALAAVLIAVKGQAAPETGHAYARARELWARLGSPSGFLQIPFGQSRYHMYRGEFDLAQRLAEDLLRLSGQRNDSAGLVLGHCSSGRNLSLVGSFASSRSHLEEALALYDPVSHRVLVREAGVDPQVLSQAFLGIVLFCLGYPDQALAQSRAAIAEARRLTHPPSLASALAIGAGLLSLGGDNAALGDRADELVAITTEQGFPAWHAQGTIYRGYAKAENGDVVEGVSLLRSGLSAYRATGTVTWIAHLIALLASACQLAGQAEESLALLDDALHIVESTRERWLEAELNRHKGQLLLQQGHTDAAEDLYRKALSIAGEQEARLWELRAAVSLAQLLRDHGRRAEAGDLLRPVYDRFTEGFDTLDLKHARTLLDELTP